MVRALLDAAAAPKRHKLVIVNVMVFNPGSSSLKFDIIEADLTKFGSSAAEKEDQNLMTG